MTTALVTAAAPVMPLMVVGPVAFNVKAEGVAVPPLLLVTVFTKVSVGALSLLLMVQVAVWPEVRTSWLRVSVPDEQTHAPAV